MVPNFGASNDTIDSLVTLLENSHLSFKPDGCVPDDNFTAPLIEKAFEKLVVDAAVFIQRSTDKMMAELFLRIVFNHLAESIRAPYVTGIRSLEKELLVLQTDAMAREMRHVKDLSRMKDKHLRKMLDLEDKHRLKHANCIENERKLLELTNEQQRKLSEAAQNERSLLDEHQRKLSETEIENQRKLSDLVVKYTEKIVLLENRNSGTLLQVVDDQREAVKESAKVSSLIRELEGDKQQLLRYKRLLVQEAGIPASVTHTQTWDRVVEDNKDQQDLELPLPPNCIPEQQFARVVNKIYSTEPETYKPLMTSLNRHLVLPRTTTSPGGKVWATHCKGSNGLDGRKPDFTISIGGIQSLDVHSVIAVWEAKAPKTDIDKSDRGQLYGYLKLLSTKQPLRDSFIGVLSNLRQNIVMTLVKEPTSTFPEFKYVVKSYRSVCLGQVISYLRDCVLPNEIYHPRVTGFSHDLGDMTARLGNPLLSAVAEFPVPGPIPGSNFSTGRWVNPSFRALARDSMVVKRTLPACGKRSCRPVDVEINALRKILIETRPPTLPTILFHSDNLDEFGITPCGHPVLPGESMLPWDQILTDVLGALKWLHEQHIIHRDVRWDNVIWDTTHAVLIDLGASAYVPPEELDEHFYCGGYICCPRELIGNFDDEYLPQRKDDCAAFVLMVNMLLWPGRWTDVASHRVATYHSSEADRLTRFWEKLEASLMWGRFVRAADVADYDTLAEMAGWCVYW